MLSMPNFHLEKHCWSWGYLVWSFVQVGFNHALLLVFGKGSIFKGLLVSNSSSLMMLQYLLSLREFHHHRNIDWEGGSSLISLNCEQNGRFYWNILMALAKEATSHCYYQCLQQWISYNKSSNHFEWRPSSVGWVLQGGGLLLFWHSDQINEKLPHCHGFNFCETTKDICHHKLKDLAFCIVQKFDATSITVCR